MQTRNSQKIKKGIAFVFVLTASIGFGLAQGSSRENGGVSFKGKADRGSILVGEPVRLEFEFVNEGTSAVRIPRSGVDTGALKIFVARKGEAFEEYYGPGWGGGAGSSFR